jgi:hypothetical protein
MKLGLLEGAPFCGRVDNVMLITQEILFRVV